MHLVVILFHHHVQQPVGRTHGDVHGGGRGRRPQRAVGFGVREGSGKAVEADAGRDAAELAAGAGEGEAEAERRLGVRGMQSQVLLVVHRSVFCGVRHYWRRGGDLEIRASEAPCAPDA